MVPGMPDSAEKLRVLLVEDDRDLADVTRMGLEMEGLDVSVAYDGREALAVVERVHPDVVITDLIMPVLDGLQLIQQLLSRPAPCSPVIAISAVGSRLRTARELGAVEALVKRSEEHTSELQSLAYLVCRLLLEKKKKANGVHYAAVDGLTIHRQYA